MRLGSGTLVAASLVALGGATLLLAATSSQERVLFVEEVLDDPAAHRGIPYTLMGIPQPVQVPLTGPEGTVLRPNAHYGNATVTTMTWLRDGIPHYSTHTLTVAERGGRLVWHHRNETRLLPTDSEPALPIQERAWEMGDAGQAFPVEAFGDGARQRVWAWYERTPENPIQPKPSQFAGHLMERLPDGQPLPDGALVYVVTQYTAGCSSKFLPPELREPEGAAQRQG